MASALSDPLCRTRRRLLIGSARTALAGVAGLSGAPQRLAAEGGTPAVSEESLAGLLETLFARTAPEAGAAQPMSEPAFPDDLRPHPDARYEHWQWRSIRWTADGSGYVDAHWQRFDRLTLGSTSATAVASAAETTPGVEPSAWDANDALVSQGVYWRSGSASPQRRVHVQRDALGLAASRSDPARIHVLNQSLSLEPMRRPEASCAYRIELRLGDDEHLQAELLTCPLGYAVRSLAGWQALASLPPPSSTPQAGEPRGVTWVMHRWGPGALPAKAPVVLDTLVLYLPDKAELHVEQSKRRLQPGGPRRIHARWHAAATGNGADRVPARRLDAVWESTGGWRGDVTGLQYAASHRITLPALQLIADLEPIGDSFEVRGADGWQWQTPVIAHITAGGAEQAPAYGFLQSHPESR